jgi:ferritin-like protein
MDEPGPTGPPPADRMLQFFSHAHLPKPLADVSRPFCELAETICATLPSNPERTVALRKLLEAKDCAVRALIYK